MLLRTTSDTYIGFFATEIEILTWQGRVGRAFQEKTTLREKGKQDCAEGEIDTVEFWS